MRKQTVEATQGAWHRTPSFIRTPIWVMGQTFRLYVNDDCGTYAAAIAYYALFSIVPLSLITLSILGLVVDQERIVRFVFDQIPLRETQAVQNNVDSIVGRAKQISVAGLSFGVIALVWSGSGIFSAVRRGLNAAGNRRGRPYWRSKMLDFLLIPAFGLMILSAIVASAALQVLIERGANVGPISFNTSRAFQLASYGATATGSFTMFFLLYRFVPAERERWRPVVASALFATLLFELVKNTGAFVISKAPFSTDTAIYAGFSTAFAFLFWVFLNASILLLGAEFGRAIALHGRERRQRELLAEASARHATQVETGVPSVTHMSNL
ncbi:hypothetical protein AYO38_06495 [bacterium SCGC AG-212-C10]|nr:hypothetical protein AYO38_06495 [bacterium SCGC AG-212-C10]